MRPARAADRARGRRRARTGAGRSRSSPGSRVSFLVSILFATWILDKLGLPKDLLRNISIALLFLIAAIADRPAGRRAGSSGRCRGSRAARPATSAAASCSAARSGSSSSRAAGRRSRTSRVSAASGDFGLKTILVAVAYTLGFSVVLLAIALGGRRVEPRGCAPASSASASPSASLIAAVGVRARLQPRHEARRPGFRTGRRLPPGPHRGERLGPEGVRARRRTSPSGRRPRAAVGRRSPTTAARPTSPGSTAG